MRSLQVFLGTVRLPESLPQDRLRVLLQVGFAAFHSDHTMMSYCKLYVITTLFKKRNSVI